MVSWNVWVAVNPPKGLLATTVKLVVPAETGTPEITP